MWIRNAKEKVLALINNGSKIDPMSKHFSKKYDTLQQTRALATPIFKNMLHSDAKDIHHIATNAQVLQGFHPTIYKNARCNISEAH